MTGLVHSAFRHVEGRGGLMVMKDAPGKLAYSYELEEEWFRGDGSCVWDNGRWQWESEFQFPITKPPIEWILVGGIYLTSRRVKEGRYAEIHLGSATAEQHTVTPLPMREAWTFPSFLLRERDDFVRVIVQSPFFIQHVFVGTVRKKVTY